MESIKPITLPSFLRRTMKAYALKAYIREIGCDLNRIGRSRNWLLKANISQLQNIVDFIEENNEESWIWLSNILKIEYQHLSHESLVQIATRLNNITVATIMTRSGCTLLQARKVLDELEDLD